MTQFNHPAGQRGAAPLALIIAGAAIIAVLGYVYLRQTGTADNAAAAISHQTQELTNEAAAEYHEFRAENLATNAAETTSLTEASEDSAAAMDHKLQELDARAAAQAHGEEAAAQGTVVQEQVKASVNAAESSAKQVIQPAAGQ